MIFKNINSEDISGLIICSEPPISSSAIRTKETTIDGRDGAIVEKLGYKTRIRNVEIGLKKDANVDKILSYFSGEGDLIFKNENDKVYKAAIYEQVDLERLLRLRKGSVAFYCQPFKYKRNDIFETIKDNKVKEKKGEYLELLNCAEQNVVDLKLEGSTSQVTRSGKNFFNASKIPSSTGIVVTDNGKTITMPVITAGNGYTSTSRKLSELCPNLKVGDVVTLRFNRNLGIGKRKVIYLSGVNYTWYATVSLTITQEMLDSTVILYGNTYTEGETEQWILTDFSIMLSSETDTSWEQYGASPSPDYPSEIENVEGKNKLNISTIVKGRLDSGVIGYETNVTKLILNKNSFTFTVNSTYKGVSSDFIPVIPNKIYVYSQNESLTDSFYIGVACYDKNKNWLKNLSIVSITIPANCYYIKIQWASLTIGTQTVTNPQLEEGTVATPYVSYNSLEIKDIGENLLDLSKCQFNGCKIGSDGKSIISNISNNYYCELITTQLNDYLLANKGKTLTFLTGTLLNKATAVVIYGTRTNGSTYQEVNEQRTGKCSITVADDFTTITAVRLRFNMQSTLFTDTSTTINYAMLVLGTEEIPYKPYKEQKLTFPLSEGQKLYEGSYLADDGIHHLRKQVVFDGSDEDWTSYSTQNRLAYKIPILNIKQIISTTIIADLYCDYYTKTSQDKIYDEKIDYGICQRANQSHIIIRNKDILTLAEWKAWLSEHPITVEYELATEEIVPYTTAQQEAYNQLQKLKLYKGQNTMFSLEGSIINLKYLEDTDEKVENQGNIYSKPIIRLEKTVFKEVEIAINGIRFKYNFEEDDYVEIDCEEMTVQYEGLDRNRRLVIDFEFPKLKEGNNDIVMYSGDCIIKCKRKDRWL